MWTEADPDTYRQAGDRLPSDLSDGDQEPGTVDSGGGSLADGRARPTCIQAMNAIFYLLRTGCQIAIFAGRALPPRSTVYNIFRAFPRGGWEGSGRNCARPARTAGAERSPSAGASSTASRSKSAEKGDARKAKQTQWVTTLARR